MYSCCLIRLWSLFNLWKTFFLYNMVCQKKYCYNNFHFGWYLHGFYRCGVWNSGRKLQVTPIVIQWKASHRTKMVGEHNMYWIKIHVASLLYPQVVHMDLWLYSYYDLFIWYSYHKFMTYRTSVFKPRSSNIRALLLCWFDFVLLSPNF